MSNDGMYFYSIDKGSLEIAVGTLVSGDDDSYEDDDDDYYEDDNDTEEIEISNEQDESDDVFEYLYTYKSIAKTHKVGEPNGIYTSPHGNVVVTSDTLGNIWISTNFGIKWKHGTLTDSDTSAIYITGCIFSKSGDELIVSTNDELIYHSDDSGTTFNVRAQHRCSIMTASEDLSDIICING